MRVDEPVNVFSWRKHENEAVNIPRREYESTERLSSYRREQRVLLLDCPGETYLDLRSERRFRDRFVFLFFSFSLALALLLGFLFFFLVFEGPLKVRVFSCSGPQINIRHETNIIRSPTFARNHAVAAFPRHASLAAELVFELRDGSSWSPRAFDLLLAVLSDATPSNQERQGRGVADGMKELNDVEPRLLCECVVE